MLFMMSDIKTTAWYPIISRKAKYKPTARPRQHLVETMLIARMNVKTKCFIMNKYFSRKTLLSNLNAKSIERKNGYIAYLKEAEKISDFLGIVGAHVGLMKFEDVRIIRDMRNSVNRLVNCETANMNKTIGAAQRQVGNIKYIQDTIGLAELPERLQEIAQLRIDHQDITLKELGELVTGAKVSKSGVNHRLRKIEEIADNLRNGGIGIS